MSGDGCEPGPPRHEYDSWVGWPKNLSSAVAMEDGGWDKSQGTSDAGSLVRVDVVATSAFAR